MLRNTMIYIYFLLLRYNSCFMSTMSTMRTLVIFLYDYFIQRKCHN